MYLIFPSYFSSSTTEMIKSVGVFWRKRRKINVLEKDLTHGDDKIQINITSHI